MKTVVFFDLGNTIVNYHYGLLSDLEKDQLGLLQLQALAKTLGVQVTYEILLEKFYLPWIEALKLRKMNKQEFDVKPFLSQVMPSEIVNANFRRLMLALCEPSSRLAVPVADITEVLPILARRGIGVGLISNTPWPGFCHDYTLELLGLRTYFSCRLYSYEVGCRKPHSEIFLEAMRRMQAAPENCIMIGDSLELDITPAAALGMRVCHYVGVERPSGPLPDSAFGRITNFKALLDIFQVPRK